MVRKMKIAYVAYFSSLEESGILKKIIGQTKSWKEKGYEVQIFIFVKSDIVGKNLNNYPINIYFSRKCKTFWVVDNFRFIKKILNWKPDLLFLRFTIYIPLLIKLIRAVPTVIEINTDDKSEYKNILSPIKYFFHLITREYVLKNVEGITCVTNELSEKFKKYKKPILVNGNGIDLSEFIILPPNENNVPELIFVGTPGYSWHGIDKIILLARIFIDWKFHIVGYERGNINAEIPCNVYLHGYMQYNNYKHLLSKSDIGIGTLALHRKNMNEACALKVREYLACGIPSIIAYKDTDFFKAVPYLLEISNEENNIIKSKDNIDKFVNYWKGKRINRSEILKIDYKQKATNQLMFFKSLIQ
jgi:hypothetical protein